MDAPRRLLQRAFLDTDARRREVHAPSHRPPQRRTDTVPALDRKSKRLNSSHITISYAVFCLKKKMPEWVRQSVRIAPPSREDFAAPFGGGAVRVIGLVTEQVVTESLVEVPTVEDEIGRDHV